MVRHVHRGGVSRPDVDVRDDNIVQEVGADVRDIDDGDDVEDEDSAVIPGSYQFNRTCISTVHGLT